jgi:hypothetical protein
VRTQHLGTVLQFYGRAGQDATAAIVGLVERGLKAAQERQDIERYMRFCVEWPWGRDRDGYGIVNIAGERRSERAHRLAYKRFFKTELTSSDVVMHTCDNPGCVNPYHLRVGTHQDNQADKAAKGRQAQGSQVSGAKLTWETVREIRHQWSESENLTMAALAEQYGVSRQNIGFIVRGETWREPTMPQ